MNLIKSKALIEIVGINPQKFILKLNQNNINIYRVNKINSSKFEILVNYQDLKLIKKINTIYKIRELNYLGIVKVYRLLLNFYHVILGIILGIISLYLLSNVIFKVEIITNDSYIQKRLIKSLDNMKVGRFHLKKNYDYLQNVKENILNEYNDEIEWLEINNYGTKYIVKYEPKVLSKKNKEKKYKNIVAKKNAIILGVYSSSGNIIKTKDSYVKKGDIVISSDVYLNEEKKDNIAAKGKVLGEVWYETKVVYPYNYFEQKKTGNKNQFLRIRFLNKKLDIFKFKHFNDKIYKENKIIKNNLIPFGLYLSFEEEVITKTGMNVVEELELLAVDFAYNKLNDSLKKDEYIINYKILSSEIIPKGIEMRLFFSVAEDITAYE